MLRHASDRRTLLWALAMPVAALTPFVRPEWSLVLCPLSCYLALSAGVIAHNHNHSPTFKARGHNEAFGIWLSIFYGYPTFAWIPTHNLNHHKLVNRAGDATITWRHTNKNNFLVAGTYFFVSSYFQSDPIKAYIRKARVGNPALFRKIVVQYVAWAGAHVVLFSIACALHGFGRGALVWLFAFGIPAFFALWTIMFFNYVQHVHTDPFSELDHSRSFTGPVINFLLFNNAFHTAHHEQAGAHWSTLPAAHAKLAARIHPELQPRSFGWWCVKVYLLAPFFPKLGTMQLGRAPFDAPSSLDCDEVEALETGLNTPRLPPESAPTLAANA